MRIAHIAVIAPLVALSTLAACANTEPELVSVTPTSAHPHDVITCQDQNPDPPYDVTWAELDVHPVVDTALTETMNTEFEVDFEIVNVGTVRCENAANEMGTSAIAGSLVYPVDPYGWDLEPGDSVLVRGHYRAVSTGSGQAQLVTDYNHYVAGVSVTVP